MTRSPAPGLGRIRSCFANCSPASVTSSSRGRQACDESTELDAEGWRRRLRHPLGEAGVHLASGGATRWPIVTSAPPRSPVSSSRTPRSSAPGCGGRSWPPSSGWAARSPCPGLVPALRARVGRGDRDVHGPSSQPPVSRLWSRLELEKSMRRPGGESATQNTQRRRELDHENATRPANHAAKNGLSLWD